MILLRRILVVGDQSGALVKLKILKPQKLPADLASPRCDGKRVEPHCRRRRAALSSRKNQKEKSKIFE